MVTPENEQRLWQFVSVGMEDEAYQALVLHDPNAIKALARGLWSKDPVVRQNTTELLTGLGPLAVEPLCQTLQDRNWVVRSNAAALLGKLGDAHAVEALCQSLRDENSNVRRSAGEALLKFGHAVIEPLAELLEDINPIVRREAAVALGRLADGRAVEPLCQALGDEDWIVRRDAAMILRRLGDPTTLPRMVLLEARLTPQQRFRALNALGHVKGRMGLPRYPVSDVGKYCRQQLRDRDPQVRQAARALLDAATLLKASSREEAPQEREELLRGTVSTAPRNVPEEMLRGASEPKAKPTPQKTGRRSLFRWLRRD